MDMLETLKSSLRTNRCIFDQLKSLRSQLSLALPAIGVSYLPNLNVVLSLGDYDRLPFDTPFITLNMSDELLMGIADVLIKKYQP